MAHRLGALGLAFVFLARAASAQTPVNADPPAAPILRVDAGMHTADINSIATNAKGDLIATASDDKTVRLWHAADGSLIATLRVPIAQGAEGGLNAVAVAPDGKRVLAGGDTGFSFGPGFALYLFDTDRQAMVGRLPNLPAAILDVAYAPSGRAFAIGFAKTAGVRLYDNAGKLLVDDHDYADRVSALAFDANDRFATASYDGQIRLYDASGKRIAMSNAPGGKRPASLAFSPDGKFLAVGYDDAARVDVLSAIDLSPHLTPKAADVTGTFSAVAWSGNTLVAAGSARNQAKAVVIRRWPNDGAGAPSDLAVGRDLVTELTSLPGGGVAFASADPAWGKIDAIGKLAYRQGSVTDDFRVMNERRFDVAPDGLTVEFSPAAPGNPVLRFDLRQRKLARLSANDAAQRRFAAKTPAAKVTGLNTAAPTIDGVALSLPTLELARSVVASTDRILLGTDFNLRSYDRNGHEIAPPLVVPAPVWALTMTADGATAVAALGDGTLRWYALKAKATPVETAAMFVPIDGRRWVMWTPQGFFDHADAGGKELVGYQLNHGKGDAPEWIGFAQLYRAFYAPDLVLASMQGQADAAIKQRLATIGDVHSYLRADALPQVTWVAWCMADAAGKQSCTPLDPGQSIALPPDIAAKAQAAFVNATLPAGAGAITLRYRVTARGGVGPSDLFLNGRNAGRVAAADMARDLKPVPGGAALEGERAVALDGGVNQIELRVYDKAEQSYAVSDAVSLLAPPKPAAAPPLPRLFILAAGIDKYVAPAPALDLAVTDAKSFVGAIRLGAKSLYREIDAYELYDEQASAAGIDKALDDIATKATSDDVLLVYLAGHGEQVDNDYYFITQDFRLPNSDDDAVIDAAIKKQGLSGEDLVAHLGKIGAKNGFLFLDTCHAGAIRLDTGSARINQESGRYILVASQRIQTALDSYDGKNGVFAYAVLEGLKGKARQGAGPVDDIDLGFYVSSRVAALAQQQSHDQSASFKISAEDARRFPIGVAP